MRSGEQAPIALVASSIHLTQDHVHYWVGQGIPNTNDSVIVGVAHPQELSVAHGRYPEDPASQSDLFPRSKHRERGFPFPYRMEGD